MPRKKSNSQQAADQFVKEVVRAGATLAAGGILGGLALADFDELEGMPVNDPGYRAQQDRADGEALAADVLVGVGVVSAAVALTLFLLDGDEDEPAAAAIVPCTSGRMTGVAAEVRW